MGWRRWGVFQSPWQVGVLKVSEWRAVNSVSTLPVPVARDHQECLGVPGLPWAFVLGWLWASSG